MEGVLSKGVLSEGVLSGGGFVRAPTKSKTPHPVTPTTPSGSGR